MKLVWGMEGDSSLRVEVISVHRLVYMRIVLKKEEDLVN